MDALDSDPEAARFRLFGEVGEYLAAAAAVSPLVLILDDLQWADLSSLLLLQFLAPQLPRRWRLRGDDRAVPGPRTGLGLPSTASGLDQHLRAQIRLVYPGVGWVVWRNVPALPEELIYRVNYLGDEMATFALNFSRLHGVRRLGRAARDGWQVPAYTFPAQRIDLAVLRFVIRNGMTHDLAQVLLADLRAVLARLARQQESTRDARLDASFAHDGRSVQ